MRSHLSSLDIDGPAVQLLIEGNDNPVKTRPLHNLVSVCCLRLRGTHDGRWLFLLKYAPYLTEFRCDSPPWTSLDDGILPFDNYNLKSLSLHNSHSLTEQHFLKLLTVTPSADHPRSVITHLELVNIPQVLSSPKLPYWLSLTASTLENLRLSPSTQEETHTITRVLRDAASSLSNLTHLSTTARTLNVFPPSLHSFTVSLSSVGSDPTSLAGPQSSDILGTHTTRVGMIYSTVVAILDAAQGSRLKSLTIVDAALSDYLHFHLAGSRGYGDPREMSNQDRLWRQAAIQGVLVTVVNPAKDSDFEEQQVGAPFDPIISIAEPDLTRSFPHLG